jgi:hypothetical protein
VLQGGVYPVPDLDAGHGAGDGVVQGASEKVLQDVAGFGELVDPVSDLLDALLDERVALLAVGG